MAMTIRSRLLPMALLSLALLLAGCSLFGSGTHRDASVTADHRPRFQIPASDDHLDPHVPKQLIIGLGHDTSADKIAAELGAQVVDVLSGLGAALLELPADSQVVDALQRLEHDTRVRYTEPNYHVATTPYEDGSVGVASSASASDLAPFALQTTGACPPCIHPRQWGIGYVGAPVAWQHGVTGEGVVIAVLDTGIDPAHPDLGQKILWGYNTVSEDEKDWTDRDGHGTHVAGIAAGAGARPDSIVGVAYESSLLAIKVLENNRGTIFSIAQGIEKVIEWRQANIGVPTVINMSLGGPGYSSVMKEAVDAALAQGIVVVVAMGNDQRGAIAFPAAYPGVIAVGAVAPKDRTAHFTSTWRHMSVSAPGVDIYSAYPLSMGLYATASGTSMASPFVAGAAALLLHHDGSLSPAQVRTRLETFARHPDGPGQRDSRYGHGVINVPASLFGDSGLNFYGSVEVHLVDQDGERIDVSRYNTPPRGYQMDFVVEVLLEHPSRPGPLPIQASDDGTGLFYHVPIDSGWKVVATAWPIDGSARSGTAMVGEIQPGKTTTVTVQLDLR